MRAARVTSIGDAPRLEEIAAPQRGNGEALLDVSAVALNPLDVAVAAGRFYGGHPPLPYIPGCEAVGRVREATSVRPGARVYVFGQGIGLKRNGTLGEVAAVPEAAAFEIPDEPDDALAVACGIAGVAGWAATTRRAIVGPDDDVLVFGATGTVGRVALQAARIRGARRIVAAGRDPDRLAKTLELGADATLQLGEDDLVEGIENAFGGEGPSVVIDPLWGAPARAAVGAAAPRARLVQVGQSAGAEATFTSAAVRGKELEIRGYSNFALSHEDFRSAYLELLDHVRRGDLRIDVETYDLDRIADAWHRQAEGAGVKIVVSL